LIAIGQGLEVAGELVIRYDVNRLQIWNIGEIVQDPFDYRFASDREQGLGLVERKRIKTRCVARSEDEHIHRKVRQAAATIDAVSSSRYLLGFSGRALRIAF